MPKEPANEEKWLAAHQDPLASLYTFTQCIALSDIHADNDNKLIIADLGTGTYEMKLKVYKGTSLLEEHKLIDLPIGLVSFYMDIVEPRIPALAVASGPYVFVYKNLRPYFKFTLPPLPLDETEAQIWNQIKMGQSSKEELLANLEKLKSSGIELSVRSLTYLQTPVLERDNFIITYKNSPLKRQTVITGIDTMKKSMAEEDAVSCLVLSTESKSVYILDTEAFVILATMTIPSVAVCMFCMGIFDIEYRILVACRNGSVYSIKRGSKEGKLLFDLNCQAIGIKKIAKTLIIACMDSTLSGYSLKGKRQWRVTLPSTILTIELMDQSQIGLKAVLVALNNSEVHLYKENQCIAIIKTSDPISGIRFGKYGREDSTLIMTTINGGLIMKILKRSAKFEPLNNTTLQISGANTKLKIPKRTKLFVDQTLRERDNGIAIHRQFQQDLYRLRLETARNYTRVLESGLSPVSSNPLQPLKLSAYVNGIGPTFRLTATLQNASSVSEPCYGYVIVIMYDDSLYMIGNSTIDVPLLVPGALYTFESLVYCQSTRAISDIIKVYIMKKGFSSPVITAIIDMPISESIIA